MTAWTVQAYYAEFDRDKRCKIKIKSSSFTSGFTPKHVTSCGQEQIQKVLVEGGCDFELGWLLTK